MIILYLTGVIAYSYTEIDDPDASNVNIRYYVSTCMLYLNFCIYILMSVAMLKLSPVAQEPHELQASVISSNQQKDGPVMYSMLTILQDASKAK